MSNQRIVNFSYFVATLLMFYVLGKLLYQFWGHFGWRDTYLIGEMGYPWVISAVVTGITLFVVLRSEKVTPFLLEVVAELREVTWPTRQEVISHTRVVIVTVVVIAVILGAFDVLWAKLSKFLLNPTL